MTIKRAIEILNPEHSEHYDSLDEVNEACQMGMEALKRQIPCKLSGKHGQCPNCNVVHCLHNQDGAKCVSADSVVKPSTGRLEHERTQ